MHWKPLRDPARISASNSKRRHSEALENAECGSAGHADTMDITCPLSNILSIRKATLSVVPREQGRRGNFGTF